MRSLLHKLTRFHRQGALPNAAIVSSARSGSTWLMELIATQPGFKYVNEPFYPDHLIACGIAKPPASQVWRLVLPHDDREKLIRSFLQAIERNEVHIGEPRFLSRFYRLYTNRIVFKILRAQDLTPWFQDTFGWKIVYLVRHPLAANLSRKEFPRLDLFLENESFVSRYLTPEKLAFSRQIQSRGTKLQKAVLDWCLQNYPVLTHCRDRDWLLMHYEDLVCQPEVEVDRLTSRLTLRHPDLIRRHLFRASSSTYQSDRITRDVFRSAHGKPSTEFLLSNWRNKLTLSDEEEAFQVLDAFEIDIYGRGLDQPVRRLATPLNDRQVAQCDKGACISLGVD